MNYRLLTMNSFTNYELEISNATLGGLAIVQYWIFSFIVSEQLQVNPDNSLACWER